MSDAAAHASASATRSGLGIGVLAHSGQSTYADEELTATLPVEEQAVEHICFLAKQANTSTEVRLTVKDTVAELKAVLFDMTDIPPERQKILGLVKGRLSTDDTLLGEVQYPPTSLRASPNPTTGEKRVTITLIGTPLDQTFKDPGANAAEEDVAGGAGSNDIDYNDSKEVSNLRVEPAYDRKSLGKLRQAVSRFSFTFPIMNEPRDGLKGGLLVLDLDYTMADTKRLLNYHVNARESERPGLQEFLAAVYPYYDLVVWSQTRHWWLEAKLTELGCLTDDRYKISFVLDRTPMFSITIQPNGQEKRKHQVKALEIIWKRFPHHFGPHNTIHIDDLSRNFAMNPSCGLKIKPYKDSPSPDTELDDLKEYLIRLANHGLKSFEQLGGHKQWKELLKDDKRSEKEKEKQEQSKDEAGETAN